jgi:hypothetical protein
VVGSMPEAPGIIAAMQLAPGLATHLRGLADTLLVAPFPGATLTRGERELWQPESPRRTTALRDRW